MKIIIIALFFLVGCQTTATHSAPKDLNLRLALDIARSEISHLRALNHSLDLGDPYLVYKDIGAIVSFSKVSELFNKKRFKEVLASAEYAYLNESDPEKRTHLRYLQAQSFLFSGSFKLSEIFFIDVLKNQGLAKKWLGLSFFGLAESLRGQKKSRKIRRYYRQALAAGVPVKIKALIKKRLK